MSGSLNQTLQKRNTKTLTESKPIKAHKVIKRKNFLSSAQALHARPLQVKRAAKPNKRFSIKKTYLELKKHWPNLKHVVNLLSWKNLFFLSSHVRNQFYGVDEQQRHSLLTFVFYRNLMRIQNFAKSLSKVALSASAFIKMHLRKQVARRKFHLEFQTAVTLFRNKILIRKLCRWAKWKVKVLRMKRNRFVCDRPMKYSLRRLLRLQKYARDIFFKNKVLPYLRA